MSETTVTLPAPRATWRDYPALTKPRVISLLLLTTVGAMFIAAGGWPGFLLLTGVLIGGYMSAGAAGVYNMIIDRDIDLSMKRTSKRAVANELISTRNAHIFEATLTVLSRSEEHTSELQSRGHLV